MANNFKLTLDTLAPTGSITRPAEFLKENATLTINKGDATHMKVWFDTSAQGDKANAPENWEVAVESKLTDFKADGNYFYHLVLKDDVANESPVFNTEVITFDKTPPEVNSFELSDKDTGSTTITNDRVIKFTLECTDNMSDIAVAYITGDYIESKTLFAGSDIIENKASGDITINRSAPDGLISATVKLVDNAGNESILTPNSTASITLDTEVGVPTIILLNPADNKTVKPFIKYHDVIVTVTLDDTDIVGYKIWETTEPQSYTEYAQKGEAFQVTQAITLSDNDGEKTVYAKLIDESGSPTDPVAYTVKIDTVEPTVSLSVPFNDATHSKALISAVEGYKTTTLTMSGTDEYAGIMSYTLTNGETVLTSGSNAAVPETFVIDSSMLIEGNNTITLTVIDNADNSASASVTIELDTTAPTFDLPTLNDWYNAQFGTQFTITEKNAIAEVYAWTNTKSTDKVVPGSAANVASNEKTITLSSGDITWGLAQSATNYLHVKVMDEVGNATYKSYKFGFDDIIHTTDAPAGSIRFEKTAYSVASAKVFISYNTDDVSGITKMKVTGDITNESEDWEDVASERSVTLKTEDGQKTVYVQFKDAAGNTSPVIESTNKAELDSTKPGVIMTLCKEDGSAKPPYSAEAKTLIVLEVTDDVLGLVEDSNVEYCIWGDFDESAPDTWVPLEMNSGEATKSILVTVTDANATTISQKNFNAQIRDHVGNLSEIATASFKFDPTAPTATVKGLDHNRISKTHAARFCEEENHGTISSWADEVKFTIEPSEVITEWKVCAYATEADALAGTPADAAIGMTKGSTNMSGITNSSSDIECMIKGADYEIAIGGRESNSGEFDDIHYVVVYVKNEANLWSAKYIKA